MAAICGHEFTIGGARVLAVDDRLRASTEEFGTARPECLGQRVEMFDEIVIELHEYLTS